MATATGALPFKCVVHPPCAHWPQPPVSSCFTRSPRTCAQQPEVLRRQRGRLGEQHHLNAPRVYTLDGNLGAQGGGGSASVGLSVCRTPHRSHTTAHQLQCRQAGAHSPVPARPRPCRTPSHTCPRTHIKVHQRQGLVLKQPAEPGLLRVAQLAVGSKRGIARETRPRRCIIPSPVEGCSSRRTQRCFNTPCKLQAAIPQRFLHSPLERPIPSPQASTSTFTMLPRSCPPAPCPQPDPLPPRHAPLLRLDDRPVVRRGHVAARPLLARVHNLRQLGVQQLAVRLAAGQRIDGLRHLGIGRAVAAVVGATFVSLPLSWVWVAPACDTASSPPRLDRVSLR